MSADVLPHLHLRINAGGTEGFLCRFFNQFNLAFCRVTELDDDRSGENGSDFTAVLQSFAGIGINHAVQHLGDSFFCCRHGSSFC